MWSVVAVIAERDARLGAGDDSNQGCAPAAAQRQGAGYRLRREADPSPRRGLRQSWTVARSCRPQPGSLQDVLGYERSFAGKRNSWRLCVVDRQIIAKQIVHRGKGLPEVKRRI